MPTIEVGRPDTDTFGMFRRIMVDLDGRRAAGLRPGDHAAIEVGPGRHELVARMDWFRSEPLVLDLAPDRWLRVEVSAPFLRGLKGFLRPSEGLAIRLLG